jgi:hypothetical protein
MAHHKTASDTVVNAGAKSEETQEAAGPLLTGGAELVTLVQVSPELAKSGHLTTSSYIQTCDSI